MSEAKRRLRAVLPLLKARVTDRGDHHFTLTFGYDHGSPTTIRIEGDTSRYDLRDGDLLTLYTEVMFKEPTQ